MGKKLSHDEAMMVLARKFTEQDARGEHVDIRLTHHCLCPDDCNCRKPWRANYCGCKLH